MNPSSSRSFHKGARFGGHLLSLIALLAFQPRVQAGEAPYLLAEVFAKSEPNAVMNALDQWRGSYGSGKRQYAWSWFEAGVRGDHWGLGALWRWDYDLRFNRDAGSLYGAIENKQNLPVGHLYNVHLHANIVHASGARASWRGDLARDFQAEFGLSVLKANYMMDGSIQGVATVTGPKTYSYTATADYAYTQDVLFDRSVSPQDGLGFSLDASCRWRLRPDWQVQAQVRDLPGRIWWKNLPYTQAGANSDRTTTNAQGYTQWAPLVSGTEANHRLFQQNLPPRGKAELTYTGWRLTPAVGVDYQFDDWLPRVGLGIPVGTWKVTGWAWPTTRALGVETTGAKWKLGLSMDNIQWGLVKTVHFTVGYGF